MIIMALECDVVEVKSPFDGFTTPSDVWRCEVNPYLINFPWQLPSLSYTPHMLSLS